MQWDPKWLGILTDIGLEIVVAADRKPFQRVLTLKEK
jgi:hypothetical protein